MLEKTFFSTADMTSCDLDQHHFHLGSPMTPLLLCTNHNKPY